MGNKCSQFHSAKEPNPKTPNKNICTTYSSYDPSNPATNSIFIENNVTNLNSAFFVPPGICIPETGAPGAEEYVRQYCQNIGDDDDQGNHEWTASTGINNDKSIYTAAGGGGYGNNIDTRCNYNDCNNHTDVGGPGCCRSCCGINGTKVLCQRSGFNADPVVCCFLDKACETTNNFDSPCWQTRDKRKTCSPQYRDLSSRSCLDKIKPYCTGDKLFAGQSHWMEAWIPDSAVDVNSGDSGTATVINAEKSNVRLMKQPCLRALARAVYDDSGSVCTWEQFTKLDTFQGVINPEGLTWAEEVLESILDKYLKEFGSPIGAINQDGYLQSSSFLDFYYGLCKTFPKICEKSLNNFCSNIKAEDLVERPEAIKWCGCYMPDSQYQSFEKYSINRECTPYCNIQGNIPLAAEDFTNSICTQTSCVISDLTIKLANVINPDGFNFNQVCNSCGGSTISKIYDGINNDQENKENEDDKLIIISSDQSTLSQFIPDEYASDIKFWYTLDYPDAAKYKGSLIVRAQQCSGDPDDDPSGGYEIDNNHQNSFLVTLNYGSERVTNYNGLTGSQGTGTLWYITGIKDYIYNGDFSKNKGIILIDSYLLSTYFDSNTGKVTFKGQSNGPFYNNLGVPPVTNYTVYSPYLRYTYYLVAGDISKYKTAGSSETTLNNNIVNDPKLMKPIGGGSYVLEKAFFSCFSHFCPVFRKEVIINNDQKITNDVRIDNVTQQANTCTCILDGTTLNIQNAEVRSLDLTQNCGQSSCFDNQGNTIDCSSAKTDIIDNEIISIKNSFIRFEENLITDKRETITVGLVIILLVLFLIWLAVQHRPAKKSKISQ